jgi:hypothetical protein
LGHEYISHQNKRQRLRYMKQQVQSILNDKDIKTVAALTNIRTAVKDDPAAEFGFYNILNAAKRASEDTGVTIAEAVDYMLKKWAEVEEQTAEV